MTEDSALVKVKVALEQLLAELNSVKITICVLLTYVEQELEKKEKDEK